MCALIITAQAPGRTHTAACETRAQQTCERAAACSRRFLHAWLAMAEQGWPCGHACPRMLCGNFVHATAHHRTCGRPTVPRCEPVSHVDDSAQLCCLTSGRDRAEWDPCKLNARAHCRGRRNRRQLTRGIMHTFVTRGCGDVEALSPRTEAAPWPSSGLAQPRGGARPQWRLVPFASVSAAMRERKSGKSGIDARDSVQEKATATSHPWRLCDLPDGRCAPMRLAPVWPHNDRLTPAQ